MGQETGGITLQDDALGLGRPAEATVKGVGGWLGDMLSPLTAGQRAKGDRKKLESIIELEEIRIRAGARLQAAYVEEQRNLEAVMSKAMPLIEAAARPDEVSPDWRAAFKSKAKMTSEDDLQEVWARILAGEVNRPGTHSKRLLSTVEVIGKSEAERFQAVCSVSSDPGLGTARLWPYPFIYDLNDPLIQGVGLSPDSLISLQGMGLLRYESVFGTSGVGPAPGTLLVSLFSELYALVTHEATDSVEVGLVSFTELGIELFRILDVKKAKGLRGYLSQRWKVRGIKVYRALLTQDGQHVTLSDTPLSYTEFVGDDEL
jgi:hypothetical protein